MGEVFYRHLNPSDMGYAELRYWHEWHELIEKTMDDAVKKNA